MRQCVKACSCPERRRILKKRKAFIKEFKVGVPLDAVKGQKALGDSYRILDPSQPNRAMEKRSLRDSAELFARGKDFDASVQEAEKERLYQQIGKLQSLDDGTPAESYWGKPASQMVA
jgi:hypothetical protein